MRKVKQLKGWHICALSEKEQDEYGFTHAVIHPDNVGCGGLTPADSDWECNSLEEAVSWIQNYEV